jgi:hypothetical protein
MVAGANGGGQHGTLATGDLNRGAANRRQLTVMVPAIPPCSTHT